MKYETQKKRKFVVAYAKQRWEIMKVFPGFLNKNFIGISYESETKGQMVQVGEGVPLKREPRNAPTALLPY